jgi:uncharacterized damage-inducible protein DinB
MTPRAAAIDGIAFTALLAYRDAETARWEEWLERHPEALDVPFGEGALGTIRDVVRHIFAVELRFGQRLGALPVSAWEDFRQETLDEIFEVGADARRLVGGFLAGASDEQMLETLTFETLTAGTVTATRHKLVANLLNHGIRHWAQVATVLRLHGYADQWPHDLLLNDALP